MYYLYIIKSVEGKTYIGHTEDLEKRLQQHNAAFNKATKVYSSWKLIYHEEFSSRNLAMKREAFLKTGNGRKVLIAKGILGV